MKLLALLVMSLGASAQSTTLLNLLLSPVRCPTPPPGTSGLSVITSRPGALPTCSTLGTSFVVDAAGIINVAQIAVANTPLWTQDIVPVSGQTPVNGSITYTPSKVPITGIILYSYQSSVPFLPTSNSVRWTGAPLTITLPTGWLPTDIITFVYQYQ